MSTIIGIEDAKPATSVLQLLTPGLIIPVTNGTRLLSEARDVFSGYIGPELASCGCEVSGDPKPETLVNVYGMGNYVTFCEMIEGEGVVLDHLYLTQEQIIQFVINYRAHLHPQGFTTFFLSKMAGSFFFVVRAHWLDASRLGVSATGRSIDDVWGAGGRRQMVLPQILKP
ncbi:MAG: hypothetical protein V1704_00210 [Candidatus Vogelbacteria bacterium]